MSKDKEADKRAQQIGQLIEIFKPAAKRYDSDLELKKAHQKILEDLQVMSYEELRQLVSHLIESFISGEKMTEQEISLLYYLDISVEYIEDLSELQSFISKKYELEVEENFGQAVDALLRRYELDVSLRPSLIKTIDGLLTMSLKFPEDSRKTKDEALTFIEGKLKSFKARS